MDPKPTKLVAAATALGLSLLFIFVYGGCNWITAHRSDVSTWHFAWERFIPFVPWLIIPYMSIDLFFGAAPFLCRTNKELGTFARRITFAIIVAGGCFLLVPLTMAAPRPEPSGWTKPIFEFLYGFDQPYNLFPSLHITLRTILASLYTRHSKGAVRIAVHVWFSLIGLSTLLTYQHHVIDVAGGFILAGACFYLFRESTGKLEVISNRQVGLYYAFGAIGATGAAFIVWPSTSIFLWPAMALAIAASAYNGIGPGIYRKANGRLPLCTRVLLAPILMGQQLSLLYYRRQCDEWDEVVPGVWLGTQLNDEQATRATRAGVTAVLDLTAEFSEARKFCQLIYRNIPVLDLTQLTSRQLHEAAAFIQAHSRSGIVYVHCKAGYSRSAAAVGAFLLTTGRVKSSDEGLELLRQARPGIVLRPEVKLALSQFERELRNS